MFLQLSKTTGEKLHLVKIVSADKQLVAGFNYRMELIVAGPDNKETSYKATVYEPLGNQPKSLTQHEPIHKSTGPGKGLLGGFKDVRHILLVVSELKLLLLSYITA